MKFENDFSTGNLITIIVVCCGALWIVLSDSESSPPSVNVTESEKTTKAIEDLANDAKSASESIGQLRTAVSGLTASNTAVAKIALDNKREKPRGGEIANRGDVTFINGTGVASDSGQTGVLDALRVRRSKSEEEKEEDE